MATTWKKMLLPDAFFFQEGPGVRKWQFTSSGIKLLNVANIEKSGQLNLAKTDRHLSVEEVESRYTHFLVDEGDLVIASSGISFDTDGLLRTRGAFVEAEHLPLCLNTSTIRFKPIDGISNLSFLRHWINSLDFRRQITQRVTGSAQQNFGPSHLKELQIPLPPLSEQKRIAEILDRAEALRAKRRAALALLDELTQSIFLDMFGDPVSNPKGWPVEVIGNLDLKIADGNYSSKYPTNAEFIEAGVPFIRANNMRDMTVIHDDMRFISPEKHSELKKGHLQVGDVLITTRGEIGNVAIVPSAFQDANINAQIVLLRATSNQLNQRFLAHQLAMPQMKVRMQSFQNGVALKQLPIRQLVRVPLFVPSPELQASFSALTEEIDAMRSRLRCTETALDQLFASLQHRAFRGDL